MNNILKIQKNNSKKYATNFFWRPLKNSKKIYYKLLTIILFKIIKLINNKNKVIYIAINMYIQHIIIILLKKILNTKNNINHIFSRNFLTKNPGNILKLLSTYIN